jgi:hypothetical protein
MNLCHDAPLWRDLCEPVTVRTPPEGAEAPAEWDWRRSRAIVEGAVAQVFGVTHGDLFTPSRGRARVALARQVAMYLAHICCGLSFTEVGLLFGRDRTTVAHACAVVEDRRDDPIFDRTLELLEWIVPSLLFPRRFSAHPAREAQ